MLGENNTTGGENPYSRKAVFRKPTPEELALQSTPYSGNNDLFQQRVMENAQDIKNRRSMREALESDSSKKES